MAHHIPKSPGYYSMLKDGARYFQGLEESVYRNISACKALGQTVSTSFGPMGMNKMVINHIEKKFVTKDAATILKELEVAHPAAKIIVLAAQQQEQECGEGTNYVILLITALLEKAEELLFMGLSVADVVEGYQYATKYVLSVLKEQIIDAVDIMNREKVQQILSCTIQSKISDSGDTLAKLVTEGCVGIMRKKKNFDTDHIRIVKILGGGINNSQLIKGMVFCRDTQGLVKEAINAKVIIYSCPFDIVQTETKGTILINTAAELKAFSNEEEEDVEHKIKCLHNAGIRVVISGGRVGDLVLHYANKYKLLVVKINSKFDLRRLSVVTGASIQSSLILPPDSEFGHIDHVYTDEIGRRTVVIFEQNTAVKQYLKCDNTDSKRSRINLKITIRALRRYANKNEGLHLFVQVGALGCEKGDKGEVASIVIRGSMDGLLDEAERGVEDCINTYKCLTKEKGVLPGGGATEIELAEKIMKQAERISTLKQYSVKYFAEAFDVVVKNLMKNCGLKGIDKVTELHQIFNQGKKYHGLVVRNDNPAIGDVVANFIFDLYSVKYWGIKFATDAAISILQVDQVIMARPAGGVAKPKQPGAPNEE